MSHGSDPRTEQPRARHRRRDHRRRCLARGRPRRVPRRDRAERRRQDVAVQPALRAAPRDVRARPARRRGRDRPTAPTGGRSSGSGARSRSRTCSRCCRCGRTSGLRRRPGWAARCGSGGGPRGVREALERADWALERVGLSRGARLAPAGSLAHGDKRRLELAMVLAGDPRVILLDEPMAGVSVENVARARGADPHRARRRAQDRADGRAPHRGRHRPRRPHRRDAPRPAARLRHAAAAIMANAEVQEAYVGEAL